MRISVVIPTYNRASVLEMTLRALSKQRLAPVSGQEPQGGEAFEVIVVDDGSSDDTPQLCRRLGESFPVPFQYFRQPNKKQGAARNLGARKASGRFLLFLGDDTVPEPDFLSAHWRRIQQEPDLQARERRAVIGYTPWAEDYPVTRFMRFVGEQGWQFGFSLIDDPDNVPFNFFYTSNISLSRSLFLESGGFDEDFREYGWEDIELSLRLKKRGLRLVYAPGAVARHHHPTTLRSFLKRQRRVGYSAWTFYLKHPEMGDFLSARRRPRYSRRHRLKMRLLAEACALTEAWSWPDLSRYYPDLLSYHYMLGMVERADE